MTLKHYVVSEDGRVLNYIRKTEPTRGNPLRETNGKFGTKRRIKKSTNIYIVDQDTNRMTTKQEYDMELAQKILEYKEEEKEICAQ